MLTVIILFIKKSVICISLFQILRLENWKQRWCGNSDDSSKITMSSGSVDTESEHEDSPCDLHLRLHNVTGSNSSVSGIITTS